MTQPTQDLSYPDAVSELEGILQELNQGVVNLDVLSDRFARAIDLIEELDRRIQKSKADVEQLAERLS